MSAEERQGWFQEPLPPGLTRSRTKPFYAFSPRPGLALQLVYVPPGDFVMGSEDGAPDESPRHRHGSREGYWIARAPVTWGQYRLFCAATGRALPEDPGFGVNDDHPVVNVSFEDAKAFCDWAGLTLPTEAQWEKAARGTDGRRYPWGDEDPTREHCVFDRLKLEGDDSTAPVGGCPKGASPYGALDMAGNVWEWCEDWYDEKAYERYARGDEAPPANGLLRVIRGGGWAATAKACRAAARDSIAPAFKVNVLGLRPILRAR